MKAILETKIIKNALCVNINLHGYLFLHCNSETKAGGVTFYIKELLSFSGRNNIKVELPLVVDTWIDIKTNRGPVVVGVVYRHPTNSSCDCEKFSENLFKTFYELNLEKFLFYVLGNFIIDLNKVGKSNFVTKHVYSIIRSSCKCVTDLSTRITDHSKTLIDHIYVNNSKHSYINGVALLDLSDHFGTFVVMIAKATKSDNAKRYLIRDLSKFNHEKSLQNLANDLILMLLIIMKVSTFNLKKNFK